MKSYLLSNLIQIPLTLLLRTFYHQLLRRGMGSVAYVFTHKCLHLPRHTKLSRYVHMTTVFAVSGVFHALCDLTQGIPLKESGAMQFFVVQALAIMFEDSVTALLASLTESVGVPKPFNLLVVASKVFGYCWVVAWLAWSTPIWIFPTLQRDEGNPIIPVPASISESLRLLVCHSTS